MVVHLEVKNMFQISSFRGFEYKRLIIVVGELGAKFTPSELNTQQYAEKIEKEFSVGIMGESYEIECSSYFGIGSK